MNNWISVKDRLPEKGKLVLFCDGKNTIYKYRQIYIDFLDNRNEATENYLHNYTHWQPLPAPPKESSK